MVLRRAGGALLLALLLLSAAQARVLDADVVGDVDQALGARSSPSWTDIARCALAGRPLDCVELRSQAAVDAMLAQMTEARADDAALEPEVVDKVAELSEAVVEAAASVLEQKLGVRDEDAQGLVEEGRGKKKKKKKIHKLIALVKLVLLVLVVKLKLAFIMMALQTVFQFKIMAMVFLMLLTKKVALWASLKAAKGHDAQKVIVEHHKRLARSAHMAALAPPPELRAQQVIYYEHAQHQHHYDDHGGWGGHGHDEHADAGAGGGSGWNLWGRSYETLQNQGLDASGASQGQGLQGQGLQGQGLQGQGLQGQGLDGQVQASSLGVQSGVYRAADGTRIVVRQPDAHDMAYASQRP